MARVLLAGASSGSGKTTITCGLLQCLKNRGMQVEALKCGPDYIDPMFHSRVIGAKSGNLDPFFLTEPQMCRLLHRREAAADLTVLEGAMGYYDGVGFTEQHSTYSVAAATKTPVILVLDCKGMGVSVQAMLFGFLRFRMPSQIAGVIFNRLSPRLYPDAAKAAAELGVRPLGYLPHQKNWNLESRHLGLVMADEIIDLQQKLQSLAAAMEKTVEIDAILNLAEQAEKLDADAPMPISKISRPVTIAVAQDEAFCFLYRENLELLEELGCRLIPFSPLHDAVLPAADGLLLSGGYPELYAAALERNTSMRGSIAAALQSGMPCIAECGGFLYLHEQLEDADGIPHAMVGYLPGTCKKGERLQHFGYVYLTAQRDSLLCKAGERLTAHEFHYWQSPDDGDAFRAEKASGASDWMCGKTAETLYAGFPHFCLLGNPAAAQRFAERCVTYGLAKKDH